MRAMHGGSAPRAWCAYRPFNPLVTSSNLVRPTIGESRHFQAAFAIGGGWGRLAPILPTAARRLACAKWA